MTMKKYKRIEQKISKYDHIKINHFFSPLDTIKKVGFSIQHIQILPHSKDKQLNRKLYAKALNMHFIKE